MPHRFPRPATAGCMARIWKPYGPQPATGEPAIGKRGFTSGFPTLYMLQNDKTSNTLRPDTAFCHFQAIHPDFRPWMTKLKNS